MALYVFLRTDYFFLFNSINPFLFHLNDLFLCLLLSTLREISYCVLNDQMKQEIEERKRDQLIYNFLILMKRNVLISEIESQTDC